MRVMRGARAVPLPQKARPLARRGSSVDTGHWTLVDGHPLDRPSPHRRSKSRTRALISTDFQSVDLPVGPRVSPNLLDDTPALATARTNAQASMHARTFLSSDHWSLPLNSPQCTARTTRACAPTRRSLGAPAARPHSRPSSDLSSQGVSRLASRLLSRLPRVERRSNREAEHRTRNHRTTGHWTARRFFNQCSTMPTDREARPSCFVCHRAHARTRGHCTLHRLPSRRQCPTTRGPGRRSSIYERTVLRHRPVFPCERGGSPQRGRGEAWGGPGQVQSVSQYILAYPTLLESRPSWKPSNFRTEAPLPPHPADS